MNPFLETPLAVHQPGARWRAARGRARPERVRNGNAPHVPLAAGSEVVAGDTAQRPRACRGHRQVASPAAASRSFRLAMGILRTVALAGALVTPVMAVATVDLNAATPQQLQEVKGIGPKMARVIVEERDRGGRYASIGDLAERVKGIGPKKAAALQASGLVAGNAAGKAPDVRGDTPPATRRR